MRRAFVAEREVGGSAQEWGGSSEGGALIPCRGPTYQIVIIAL